MAKITCAYGHRMVPVVPDLLLCECSSYGRLSNLMGAVADARKLVEHSGGIEALRKRVEDDEEKRKQDRKDEQLQQRELRPKPRRDSAA